MPDSGRTARRRSAAVAAGAARAGLQGHLDAAKSQVARRTRLLTPPELAVEVSAWLADAGVQHAIGGAIAFGFHAEPRGTLDVDMNVFVAADAPEVALRVLADHGVHIDFAETSRECYASRRGPGRFNPRNGASSRRGRRSDGRGCRWPARPALIESPSPVVADHVRRPVLVRSRHRLKVELRPSLASESCGYPLGTSSR